MLQRIRGLLAKAEASEFAEEAETLSAKAQDLMTRYAIESAMVDQQDEVNLTDQVQTRRILIDNPYPETKVSLLQTVAAPNGAQVLWHKEFGLASLVGMPVDLDLIEMLYTSLLIQGSHALREAGTERRSRTPSFRRSFLLAYAHRIGERLKAARDRASSASSTQYGKELVPVLRERAEAVGSVFDEQFPRRTEAATSVTNRSGWAAGRSAAERADITGGRGPDRRFVTPGESAATRTNRTEPPTFAPSRAYLAHTRRHVRGDMMSRSGSNGRQRSRRQQIDDKVAGPLGVAIDAGGGEHPNDELFEAAVEQLESLTGQVTLTRRDNILSLLLFGEVDRLFENGWQPNELAHCAAQRLETAERRLLLMAIGIHAVMNDAERRAPSEWAAQLVELRVDELDLDVNRRPGVIAEWRIAEDFAGAAVWRHALRVIAHITSLAPLPYVCPPPRLWDSAIDVDPDLVPPASLSEIRELLRPVEAARTFADARGHISSALIAATQHGFDAALADVNSPVLLVHQVRSRRVLIDGPGVDAKTGLLQVVCENNGVRAMSMPGFAMSAIVGRPADLDVSTLLYESLAAHCDHAFRRECSESAGGVAHHVERCTRAVVDMFEAARSAVEQAVYRAHGSYGIRVLAQREAASDIVCDAMFSEPLYRLEDDVA